MAQVIFHIDINAFYASAHLITDSSLYGKPVVVCSNQRGSVVTTASYEARSFGVNSAMPLAHAKRLCPNLEVIEVDFELYQELSVKFMNIIRSYSAVMQPASIDECYVDMTEVIKKYEKPLDLAVEIQKNIWEALRLPISIGVAPNKFLAKMASDMQKPRGITVLRIREVSQKLWPLSIESMYGIGKKTVPKLKQMGIETIGDLARFNPDHLKSILGVNAQNFVQKANGYDHSVIDTDVTMKSIGQSKTFKDAMTDLDEIRNAILNELVEVMRRMERQDVVGKTVSFSIRLDDYKTATRSFTFDEYTRDQNLVFERLMSLYDEFEGEGGVSFISVTMTNLLPKDEIIEQLNIFDDLDEITVNDIIQRLNKELNQDLFKTTRSVLKEKSHEKQS
ncbi:DNA polymerase IV [Erysipelothrix rhusiopathiae]|uniref:DNA polymerase IV n=1 Tax=Erysipelothrix rhusiopathiae TaxID=1648 RepID=A0A2H4GDC6_ERYRH|nr:DNA polymerase IV [Erysipelothrix rhusiopathiae]AGN24084.1 DNA polymerase IV [Erysipelothrix rhusiopathiae SY1027]AMS11129.1 DNA polymerase IV [Erysipelothrix rhusiopathiae]AOO67627.1 DNA polymerase IV [Erysipelothrix rhusiopathiae]AQM74397.1 DNA polymerase IV [Erysipelothrix rhusiopathiae]AQM74398.1 DNA polymerase IV [Erysipelothrix rhusiopathiae]